MHRKKKKKTGKNMPNYIQSGCLSEPKTTIINYIDHIDLNLKSNEVLHLFFLIIITVSYHCISISLLLKVHIIYLNGLKMF